MKTTVDDGLWLFDDVDCDWRSACWYCSAGCLADESLKEIEKGFKSCGLF